MKTNVSFFVKNFNRTELKIHTQMSVLENLILYYLKFLSLSVNFSDVLISTEIDILTKRISKLNSMEYQYSIFFPYEKYN